MPKRTVPLPDHYNGDTNEQILDVATRLFALKGFKAVTLKDIAKEVEIKIASLYYYYDSKEALINAVLLRFGEAHKKYDEWLRAANEKAESLEEVMDNLFNEHFQHILNPITRLGISISLMEQHSYEPAYRATMEYLYGDSTRTIQRGFDRLIEKGIIPPSNTRTLASLFMFCIMSINDLHLHEAAATETFVDRLEVYDGLRALLTLALSQGALKLPE